MITGRVNVRHEIAIRIPVRKAGGQEQEIEAILDTGFTGALTLPPTLIASMGLTWRSRGEAILANGSAEEFDIYAATLIWDGKLRPVLIYSIDATPLLGMTLLIGYDLRVRVIMGGTVEIEAVQ
jgi:predicted aspartyl protease